MVHYALKSDIISEILLVMSLIYSVSRRKGKYTGCTILAGIFAHKIALNHKLQGRLENSFTYWEHLYIELKV